MLLTSLAFFCGILLAQFLPQLPNLGHIVIYASIGITVGLSLHRFPFLLQLIVGFSCGFAWLLLYTHMQLHWTLPPKLQGKNLLVRGVIVNIPQRKHHSVKFLFRVEQLQALPIKKFVKQQVKSSVRLSWYGKAPFLKVGQHWQLVVRLKQPHSLLNPNGFNAERWMLQQGIRATGYVRQDDLNRYLGKPWYSHPIDQLREYLLWQTQKTLKHKPLTSLIAAITLGERGGINQQDWQVLRATGTSHLIAISGLHISLIAALAYAILNWLWRRSSRLTLWIPAPRAAVIAALLMAFFYSAMAGFSIPTQRALIMLTVLLSGQFLKRKSFTWQGFSLALFLVLLWDPLASLSASFWLSFAAVGFIIYGISGRLRPRGLWWRYGRTQWVVSLGLLPFSLIFFQQSSIIAPFANLIAIPFVGFIVVPLSLLGVCLSPMHNVLSQTVLWLAYQAVAVIWWYLKQLASLPHVLWHSAMPNSFSVILALIGILIMLAPRGFPLRCVGLIWLLPVFLIQPTRPRHDEVWFTLLDVGQGLAAVVQTSQHVLVYDTGPSYPDGSNMGSRVLMPFLVNKGIKSIDAIVISHNHNDHSGGLAPLLKQFKVQKIYSSAPLSLSKQSTIACHSPQTWQWDGVKFAFLYPADKKSTTKGNNSSCVLKISVGQNNILLTGDIEKSAETYLVRHLKNQLSATVLVAPHHGSKTSSSQAFIQAVSADYVFFSTAYLNRYRFPDHSVVLRYQQNAATIFDTAKNGAVRVDLGATTPPHVITTRQHQRRFWQENNH